MILWCSTSIFVFPLHNKSSRFFIIFLFEICSCHTWFKLSSIVNFINLIDFTRLPIWLIPIKIQSNFIIWTSFLLILSRDLSFRFLETLIEVSKVRVCKNCVLIRWRKICLVVWLGWVTWLLNEGLYKFVFNDTRIRNDRAFNIWKIFLWLVGSSTTNYCLGFDSLLIFNKIIKIIVWILTLIPHNIITTRCHLLIPFLV